MQHHLADMGLLDQQFVAAIRHKNQLAIGPAGHSRFNPLWINDALVAAQKGNCWEIGRREVIYRFVFAISLKKPANAWPAEGQFGVRVVLSAHIGKHFAVARKVVAGEMAASDKSYP